MPYRVVITKPGSPSVLDIQNIEIPVPKADEICIQVHFAGINFADTLMRMGFYQPRPPFPFTPGYEVSGVIHTLGSDVKEFEVGQRVVGMMRTG
ncbi:MAG: alcohol dehydrogenase catalytic domain-containing protein, partial [Euryarchaeota archaeon]|nr:alcohol dehydrogenase catalytic domain-containing protein [Euryarchaeota archaeon]